MKIAVLKHRFSSFKSDIKMNFSKVTFLVHLFTRVFVVVMCGIGICWVPILAEIQGGQLFIYILAISAYLAPPVAAVYVIAILWKRSNEPVI